MIGKYKIEKWKKTNWKGTKREQKLTKEMLVKRQPKGTIINGKKVGGRIISIIPERTTVKDKQGKKHELHTIQKKVYGSGVYQVGLSKGKIVTRKLIAKRNVEWYEQRKEGISKHKMFRSSYILNNVPISKNGYFGFRIVCFSNNQDQLKNFKAEMKEKLIKWIESCTRYNSDEFWFDMYFGYESPTLANAFRSENRKYYLTMENTKGTIIKEQSGNM